MPPTPQRRARPTHVIGSEPLTISANSFVEWQLENVGTPVPTVMGSFSAYENTFRPRGISPRQMARVMGLDNQLQDQAQDQNKPKDYGPFYSAESGTTIKSKRPFGVEFEVNLLNKGRDILRDMLDRAFRLVHDGSVNNGIEVVTPILGGKLGESSVRDICKALEKVKAGTDKTCGLHVHFDAADFYSKHRASVVTLEKAIEIIKKDEDIDGYIIPDVAMKELKLKHDSGLYRAVSSFGKLDEFDICEFDHMINSTPTMRSTLTNYKDKADARLVLERLKIVVPSKPNTMYGFALAHVPTRDSYEKYKGPIVLGQHRYSEFKILVDQEYNSGVRVVLFNRSGLTEMSYENRRLRRLAAFYLAFDDVIAAMLPAKRRTNDYTKRIGTRINMHDITEASDHLKFFNLWTKTGSLKDFKGTLHDQRHNSRYYGVNFRSLLKHGTIEIRYLGGSIDPDHVLHWTALHHAVLDGCANLANDRFAANRSEKASMIVNTEAKADLFFSKLKLEKDTEDYLRAKIKEYKNDDKQIMDDLIAEDNNQ
jgi:hypothetical protein